MKVELTKDELDILKTVLTWQYPQSADMLLINLKKKLNQAYQEAE